MAGTPATNTGAREDKPKGGREKRERRDGDFQKEKSPYTERVVFINRVAKVVKGGRRFSFTALVTILEHLTAAQIKATKIKDEVMSEFEKSDKDVRFIAYKMLLENFNVKYDTLHTNQKTILKEYITSVDNTSRLKEFYTNKINEIKTELADLNKKTKNKVTKIKINEIISIITPPLKNAKITDNDLVDLLQYYDLINELETVNE